jgi:dUTP pyrophosphatase
MTAETAAVVASVQDSTIAVAPKRQKMTEEGAADQKLRVKLLSTRGRQPTRGSPLAAGYDLYSAAKTVIPAGGRALVPTDISVAVPVGTYGRVAPRSGLAVKHGLDVGAGVVDADYRGPLGVVMFNLSDKDYEGTY